MKAKELLSERRSVRKFKNEVVDRNDINEILSLASRAPSWANSQSIRYNIIEDKEVIKKISHDGVKGFVYNTKTLENAYNVCILSYKTTEANKENTDIKEQSNDWKIFDAGIAAQQFTLACYSIGVGSVIMGIIDQDNLKQIANIPDDETVASLIVYGYPLTNDNKKTKRKPVEEISRYI